MVRVTGPGGSTTGWEDIEKSANPVLACQQVQLIAGNGHVGVEPLAANRDVFGASGFADVVISNTRCDVRLVEFGDLGANARKLPTLRRPVLKCRRFATKSGIVDE